MYLEFKKYNLICVSEVLYIFTLFVFVIYFCFLFPVVLFKVYHDFVKERALWNKGDGKDVSFVMLNESLYPTSQREVSSFVVLFCLFIPPEEGEEIGFSNSLHKD